MRAIDATGKPCITIDAAATLATAAERMQEAHVGALIVTDGEAPVGIVTDRDIVVRGVRQRVPYDARIDAVMTAGVVAFDADGDLREAVHVLRSHAFRRLPRDGKLVGLLSTDDVMIDLAQRLADVGHPLTGQVLYAEPERDLRPVPTRA
jgi:CBS domain-containing protein